MDSSDQCLFPQIVRFSGHSRLSECNTLTLIFVEIFFQIVPSALLLLAFPWRIRTLLSRQSKVRGCLLHVTKLALIAGTGAFKVSILAMSVVNQQFQTRLTVPATALSLVAFLVIAPLSYYEHLRSLRPSALLTSYMLFSVVADSLRVRVFWNNKLSQTFRGVALAIAILEALLLLVESLQKKRFVGNQDRLRGPEEFGGLFSQTLFLWLNRLLRQGYAHDLSVTDLYPINDGISSERLGLQFWNWWEQRSQMHSKQLLLMVLGFMKWSFLSPVAPRIVMIMCKLTQPILLNQYIHFLAGPDNTDHQNVGLRLILAYGVTYAGLAIANGVYLHQVSTCLTLVRGILITSIYRQATSVCVEDFDQSTVTTLMSTDVDRVGFGLFPIHEIWANLIEFGFATWLLARQVGIASTAPVVIALGALIGTIAVSQLAPRRQMKWMARVEERVGTTTEILSSIKNCKLLGLMIRFSTSISALREREIQAAKHYRQLLVCIISLAYVPLAMAPVITFVIFALSDPREGMASRAARLFSSLMLIQLSCEPIASLFQAIPKFIGAVSCLVRIEGYLCAKTKEPSYPRHIVTAFNANSEAIPLNVFESRIFDGLQERSQRLKPITHNLTLKWEEDSRAVLHNVTLYIASPGLTLVHGRVASGKSTLLKSLIGEVPYADGAQINLSGYTSYCCQIPWLRSTTIRDNILGFTELDAAWYDSVIDACALHKDLERMPLGDQTFVGSNGFTLSRGQTQRIALARAVYSRKRFAILDDVLSGIDSATAQHISKHLFGPTGIFRKLDTSVIMATNSNHISHLADHVITLDSSDDVANEGSSHSFQAHPCDKGVYLDIAETSNIGEELPVPAQVQAVSKEEHNLESRKGGEVASYAYYFKAIGFYRSLVFVAILLLVTFSENFSVVVLSWWTKRPSGTESIRLAISYSILQTASLLFLTALAWHFFNYVVAHSGQKLHKSLLDTVTNASLDLFTSNHIGAIINRFSQDIGVIDSELPLALLNTFVYLFSCTAQLILAAIATRYTAATFPILVLILYLVARYYLRTSRQLRIMDLETRAPLYTQFIETVNGISTVRAFGWQSRCISQTNNLLDLNQRPFYLLLMVQRWLILVLNFISASLVLIVVGLAYQSRMSLDIGLFGVSLTGIVSFSQSITGLIAVWTTLETSLGAIFRIRGFSKSVPSEVRKTNVEPPPEWPTDGRVELRGVSASYGSGNVESALRGVNFIVGSGQRIGICGRSGSGKSSLVLAVTRLLNLTAGHIVIDGIDISNIPCNTLRHRINVIPQDPVIFSGSVRASLDPWGVIQDSALTATLEQVGLKEVVDTLGGLDVMLKEDVLSHGQRQLFCFARAMLRPGRLVIMDEVTSSVDAVTENRIQHLIRTAFTGRTLIVIAHKLNTIVDFDSIAVLDDGKLLEYGSPQALLTTDSHFRRLVGNQFVLG